MSYFGAQDDPLAYWKSQTKSLFSSNRGKKSPTVLQVDKLLKKYKDAENDPMRLGVLNALHFVLAKWLADYSGSRANAAKALQAEVKTKRDYFKNRGVVATVVAPPDPDYPEFTARNKFPGDKYFTLGMLKSGGLGKDLNNESLLANRKNNEDPESEEWSGLTYMNEQQRVRFLVTVEGGLLKLGGQTLDTKRSHITREVIGNQVYIYVMDGKGRIFSAAKQDVEHHSSFLAGNPAAAAGMMKVIDGKLQYVNGESGHYCPMKEELDQFMAEIKSRGIDITAVDVKAYVDRSRKQALSQNRGIKGARLYPTGPREEWC